MALIREPDILISGVNMLCPDLDADKSDGQLIGTKDGYSIAKDYKA